jgi:16S rRNA (guanine527-N7)-methyltransferase
MTALDRPSLTLALQKGIDALGLPLDVTTVAKLIDYLALLSKWNAVYNLTAVRDPQQMVVQHLLDSLAVWPAFKGAERCLDVGAGGGLPGLVLAICAQQLQPNLQIAMVDTVHKKTAFLTQVKAELGLANVTVHTSRVEQLQSDKQYDVITSRAFANLADFVNWSSHLLADQGRFVAMKGQLPHDEIAALPIGWAVSEIQSLQVPGLQAERHLITIRRIVEPSERATTA